MQDNYPIVQNDISTMFIAKSNVSPKIATTFEYRQRLAKFAISSWPDRVPVIVELYASNKHITLRKNKFLAPQDITIAEFMQNLRHSNMIQGLESHAALFYFFGDNTSVPPASMRISDAYEIYKHDDGLLYVKIGMENTFGLKSL